MNDNLLTEAEFVALAAVNGTRIQPRMTPQMETRLSLLLMIERRSWPNGPLWRTDKGERRVERGQDLG
jgi:hypothetical protein